MELVAAAQKDPEVMDLSVEGVEIGDDGYFYFHQLNMRIEIETDGNRWRKIT